MIVPVLSDGHRNEVGRNAADSMGRREDRDQGAGDLVERIAVGHPGGCRDVLVELEPAEHDGQRQPRDVDGVEVGADQAGVGPRATVRRAGFVRVVPR